MRSIILVAIPGLVSASALSGVLGQRDACDADNCLREVRASASLTAHSSDCLSYFATTVTPATSTVYQTLTFSATATTIVSLNLTSKISITGTKIVLNRVNETSVTTLTSPSSTVTDLVTVTDYVTGATGPPGLVIKRQETVTASSIPAYASACSGAAAYSSACSCIGATATTITAATPLTTVTLSETVTPTTQTIDTTANTVIQLTAVSTNTDVVLITSVVYLTVTDAAAITTTETTTETVLATCTPSAASTTTATVTVTVTTTTFPNDCTPGATLNNVGFFDDSWTEYCGQTCASTVADSSSLLQTTTESSYTNCISTCSALAVATLLTYNYNTGECQCLLGIETSCSASPGVDSAVLNL